MKKPKSTSLKKTIRTWELWLQHLVFGSRALLVFLAALIAASSFHIIKYFKRIYRSVSYSKEIVVEQMKINQLNQIKIK